MIDGGKGQLSAALAAMHELDLPRVAVIALAKRIEEVFVPGRAEPILLPSSSPGLQLLQRIRDEAHRFAITFHRQRRDASAKESMFDQLEGVGPARRRALLQHFGSFERVVGASQAELEGVPGVPVKTARRIYAATAPHRPRVAQPPFGVRPRTRRIRRGACGVRSEDTALFRDRPAASPTRRRVLVSRSSLESAAQNRALFDYLGGGVDDAEHVVDVAVAERIGENTTGAEAGTRLEQ